MDYLGSTSSGKSIVNRDYVDGMIAPQYDNTATYAVGDYCIYSDGLYRCTTAITTAESWTSGHWTLVKVCGEVGELKGALDKTIEKIYSANLYNYLKNTDGYTYRSNGTYATSDVTSVSEFIKVEPNTTYSAGFASGVEGPRVTMFKDNVGTGTLADTFNASGASPQTTFTTGADVNYVRVSVAITSKASLMLVKASFMPLKFVPYDYDPKLQSNVIVPQLGEIMTKSRTVNLFNKDDILHGYYNANLTFVSDASYTLSNLITVGDNTKIVANKQGRYVTFGADGVAAARSTVVNGGVAYTVPNDSVYIRLVVNDVSEASVNSEMIVFGEKLPDNYAPYIQKALNSDIVIPQIQSILSELTVNILGDSFTHMANDNASQWKWHRYITKRTGMIVNNYGVPGSCMVSYTETPYAPSFEDRYADMTDDCDAVVIFGGINDANGIESGHYTVDYFKTHVADLLTGLITKYPTKVIAALLPPNINPAGGFSSEINDVCEALAEVYTAFGIPFLDLRSASTISTVSAHLTLYNSAVDNIHWNTSGHERASFPIQKFLETYLRVLE